MAACFVTGYINVADGYRDSDQYIRLGKRMLECGQPTIAFLDSRLVHYDLPTTAKIIPYNIEDCWLYPYRTAELPTGRHPVKDNALRMATCCEKTDWIVKALDHTDAELLAWMDFGIFHITDIQPEHLQSFYQKLLYDTTQLINVGSIWPVTPDIQVDYERPCWYCAGGGLVVPRHWAKWFAAEVKAEMSRYFKASGKITWEMNVWATVVKKNPDKFKMWPCDHNRTLFTNYTPTLAV
jgi:hypothetical protein